MVDRQKLGTGAWDGRYRMERVAVARQRPVDESGITDCVSSFVVRLVVVLLAVLSDRVSLAVQLVAVLLSLVVGMLLFSSFCCSALICVVDLFCLLRGILLLFCWSFGSRVSVILVCLSLERRLLCLGLVLCRSPVLLCYNVSCWLVFLFCCGSFCCCACGTWCRFIILWIVIKGAGVVK